jgi:hypothetical protein
MSDSPANPRNHRTDGATAEAGVASEATGLDTPAPGYTALLGVPVSVVDELAALSAAAYDGDVPLLAWREQHAGVLSRQPAVDAEALSDLSESVSSRPRAVIEAYYGAKFTSCRQGQEQGVRRRDELGRFHQRPCTSCEGPRLDPAAGREPRLPRNTLAAGATSFRAQGSVSVSVGCRRWSSRVW